MRIKRAAAAIVLLAFSAGAYAGAPQPFSEDLFLDWGDLRAMLRDLGVDLRIGYVSETATNVQGGPEELWRYTDQWTFLTQFDLQKLLGIDAAIFRVTITDRNGRDLSQDAQLNTLQLVQEVYGRDQTWRWTQFWYDQQYWGGKLDWKVGRLTEGEDFASFSCEFQNLTFCGAQPGNLVGGYWYNWPVSQWGTRLKTLIPGFGYAQIGAFEVNPSYLLNPYGMTCGDRGMRPECWHRWSLPGCRRFTPGPGVIRLAGGTTPRPLRTWCLTPRGSRWTSPGAPRACTTVNMAPT